MTPFKSITYDVIVVGSCLGGSSVAREMARSGARVLIVEQRSAAPLTGTLRQTAAIAAVPGRGAYVNQDGSLLVSAVVTGGSSAIIMLLRCRHRCSCLCVMALICKRR